MECGKKTFMVVTRFYTEFDHKFKDTIFFKTAQLAIVYNRVIGPSQKFSLNMKK